MGYSIEVVRRARERLAQARSERERENREHLRVAYEQQPRLQEIDRQLRMTMAKAAMAAFAGGDAERLMAEAKQQNQSLQRERRQIVEGCFEEGFLDETPICTVCSGTGYVGSSMCDCLAELCRQEQKKELTFLNVGKESFEQFRLDYYPEENNIRRIMERTFQACRRYAYSFSEKSANLLFSGDTGLGKTFLSACIARTVADSGYSVVYESAGHLFANLERAKFANDEKTMKLISKFNKNKKKGKKEQKETGDISFKDKIINTCKLVSNILNQASYLISHIKINHLYLKLICAEVDAAFTAITYGAVCSAIYPLLGIIESKAKVKNGGFDLKIGCDYDSKKSLYDFNITFSFPLIFALIAGIRFLIKKSR